MALNPKQPLPASQERSKKRKASPSAWKPGQSGNPAGRKPDPNRKDAIELLKLNAPAVVQKALNLALSEDAPSEKVLVALLNKICPEQIALTDPDGKAVRFVLQIKREVPLEFGKD